MDQDMHQEMHQDMDHDMDQDMHQDIGIRIYDGCRKPPVDQIILQVEIII